MSGLGGGGIYFQPRICRGAVRRGLESLVRYECSNVGRHVNKGAVDAICKNLLILPALASLSLSLWPCYLVSSALLDRNNQSKSRPPTRRLKCPAGPRKPQKGRSRMGVGAEIY